MSSKNNPENRGKETNLRKIGGKIVKPVLYVAKGKRYMAAMFEGGELIVDKATGLAVPYRNI